MPCDPLPNGGFSCSRSSSLPRCQTTDCTTVAPYTCAWPLQGKKQGHVCGRRVCPAHATSFTRGLDAPAHYCPAHARMAKKEDGSP